MIAAELCGKDIAQEIQLAIEYDSQPPFQAGSPRTADPGLVERVTQRSQARQDERGAAIKRIAAGMGA
jgi:cyclohexyl-isocyanide hydratase